MHAGVGLEQPGGQLQQGRFAAPARTHDPDPGVPLDLERHILEREDLAERLADLRERDADVLVVGVGGAASDPFGSVCDLPRTPLVSDISGITS